MNEADYAVRADVTAPPVIHLEKIPPYILYGVLRHVVRAAEEMDVLKKTLVYGDNKPIPADSPLRAYESEAHAHFNISGDRPFHLAIPDGVIHGIIGLISESGELAEALLNYLFNAVELDITNLKEEIGDQDWYKRRLLKAINVTPDEARASNIAKLAVRHGAAFNALAGGEDGRDRAAERAALDAAQPLVAAPTGDVTPNLGAATTLELLAELEARARVGGYGGYRTVDHN